jgi:hypothetical protein
MDSSLRRRETAVMAAAVCCCASRGLFARDSTTSEMNATSGLR